MKQISKINGTEIIRKKEEEAQEKQTLKETVLETRENVEVEVKKVRS